MFLRDHEVAYYDGSGNHWKQTNGYKSMTLTGLPTSIEGIANTESLSVYPNPANDNVTVTMEQPMESLTIYNALGQEVKHINNIQSTKLTIPVNNLDKGVYVIEGRNASGSITISRFMKL
jgi:hypothetical protein